MRQLFISLVLGIVVINANAFAQPDGFHNGPLIKEYGPVATIDGRDPIPENTAFKVSFDVVDRSDAGTVNRNLVSAARFLNMHTEAGIPIENMSLAIVIHGSAVQDVTNAAHYDENNEVPNANAALVSKLIEHGVEIHVCGQSAAFQGVVKDDLLPGVRMSLSAMTAHAMLQQAGYTLNPF
ncbi:MAG: DsrE family protein [Pseudomonadota bacterium]